MLLGFVSFQLEQDPTCPLNALYKFDRDGNELVSHSEWDEFVCKGCHPESICAKWSCGDNCPPFEAVDQPYRMSPFIVSWVNKTAGDGLLSADEMWSARCNFLKDYISVSDMDPHLMLLVFLPVLLFESDFAIDMGVFLKQQSQIWLMALAGVLLASLLTAFVIQLMRSDWDCNLSLIHI